MHWTEIFGFTKSFKLCRKSNSDFANIFRLKMAMSSTVLFCQCTHLNIWNTHTQMHTYIQAYTFYTQLNIARTFIHTHTRTYLHAQYSIGAINTVQIRDANFWFQFKQNKKRKNEMKKRKKRKISLWKYAHSNWSVICRQTHLHAQSTKFTVRKTNFIDSSELVF